MKSKKYLYLLIIVALMCLSSCGLSKEEKEQAKEYEKQAKKNAVSYIEEKYDIEAKAIDAEYNKTGKFANDLSSYVDVKMEYNDKEFDVYIMGNKAWSEVEDDSKSYVSDNYQYEEIYDDLKEYLADATSVNIKELTVFYTEDVENTDLAHMANEYYDGDIEKFILSNSMNVRIATTDKKVGNYDGLNLENSTLEVYSYDEDYFKKYGDTIEGTYQIDEHTLWLNWSVDIKWGRTVITEYENQKFDFGYIVYEKNGSVSVDETDVDAKAWERGSIKNPKAVSDAYTIESAQDNIYVFVESDDNDEMLGVSYEKNGEKQYFISGDHNGEYITAKIDMKQYNNEVDIVVLVD